MKPGMSRMAYAWDRLSLYLPVILMAALALGTYVLTKSQQQPVAEGRSESRAAQHDVDYVMQGFAVRSFEPSGWLGTQLHGGELRHYTDTDTFEVDTLWLRQYDSEGRRTDAQADRGYANHDGSDITLSGSARLMRPGIPANGRAQEPLIISSQFLHLQPNLKRLETDQPVRVVRGRDVITAGRLSLDGESRTLQLGGRLKAVIQPKAAP